MHTSDKKSYDIDVVHLLVLENHRRRRSGEETTKKLNVNKIC